MSTFDALGYRAMLDQIQDDLGCSADPITKMLTEQLVLLHLQSLRLHGDAGSAENVAVGQLYLNGACRTSVEFRKTLRELVAYEQSPLAKRVAELKTKMDQVCSNGAQPSHNDDKNENGHQTDK